MAKKVLHVLSDVFFSGAENVVCQIVILVTTVYSGAEYFIKNADVFKS